MAKRKRLSALSVEEIEKLAEAQNVGGKRPAALGVNMPPIARVAGDAASVLATDNADARRYQAAIQAGLVVQKIPLNQIDVGHLSRDRLDVNDVEMEELRHSILAHGLRMPIEVLPIASDTETPRFGLISGWRRMAALDGLLQETGRAEFGTVPALVRQPKESSDAYISMVEENEIRSDLSHFERGRIAVIAAKQGAFASVEAAVNALFGAGSKAKRSKIRSFALIFEELGDLLRFPTQLSERAGLNLAAALKAGRAEEFRVELASGDSASFELEWNRIEKVIRGNIPQPEQPKNDSKPKKSHGQGVIELANGVTIEKINGDGVIDIRFSGKYADNELVDTVMLEIQRMLEPS